MRPLMTDAQFQSIALVVVALIGIIPATLAAVWSRESKRISKSVQQEVRTNGGMSDPNPNINDHIKYQTEMIESIREIAVPLVKKVESIDERFTQHLEEVKPASRQLEAIKEDLDDHLKKSAVMDRALAELYLTVRPEMHLNIEDL